MTKRLKFYRLVRFVQQFAVKDHFGALINHNAHLVPGIVRFPYSQSCQVRKDAPIRQAAPLWVSLARARASLTSWGLGDGYSSLIPATI